MPGTQQVHNKALKNRGAQNEWASKSECNCPLAKVIVIGHGMMIEAVTGVPHPNFGEIVPFSLVGKE